MRANHTNALMEVWFLILNDDYYTMIDQNKAKKWQFEPEQITG